ncbi:hypothetical protein [Borreliella bavariensis]|uniref:hypothetical protein n=1 Tax=Borreliella bavariensis TaxID=664662 RepID=UPI001F3872CB|nr:hypothetical protein [Borreliella bavariensis]
MNFKARWIDIVNQIINYCENNIKLNDIKDNSEKIIGLMQYINLNYEYFLKYEILKTENF